MRYLLTKIRKVRKNSIVDLLLSFTPWVVYFIFTTVHYLTAEIAASVAFISVLMVSRQKLGKKFIIDWCTVRFWCAFILYLTPIKPWLIQYSVILSNVIIAFIMWLSIIIKQPFSIQYAREEVEAIVALTPTFKQINYAISLVWAATLSLLAIVNLLQSFQMITSNLGMNIANILLLSFAIWFTRWFPDWYQGFLFGKSSQKLENIAENRISTVIMRLYKMN